MKWQYWISGIAIKTTPDSAYVQLRYGVLCRVVQQSRPGIATLMQVQILPRQLVSLKPPVQHPPVGKPTVH